MIVHVTKQLIQLDILSLLNLFKKVQFTCPIYRCISTSIYRYISISTYIYIYIYIQLLYSVFKEAGECF